VTAFIPACLYFFAACAAIGILPAAVLAAKARSVAGTVASLAVAAFVIFVLVTAAGGYR
jgi:hypothetical protein